MLFHELDDYQLEVKPLGRGAFGTVYRAHKNKKFYAIKVFEYNCIEEEDAANREINQETSAYTRLNHKYLCTLVECVSNSVMMKANGKE